MKLDVKNLDYTETDKGPLDPCVCYGCTGCNGCSFTCNGCMGAERK